MIVNDSYTNAVVGRLVEVASRSWGDDRRMVTVKTDDPFVTIVVRQFINNYEDAEILVDRLVVVWNGWIYPLYNSSETCYSFGRNNNNKGEEQ